MSTPNKHMAALQHELNWFARVLDLQFRNYFSQGATEADSPVPEALPNAADLPLPIHNPEGSNYGALLHTHNMGRAERVAIMLALVPHLQPQLLDVFFTKNAHFDRRFTEFGGYQGKTHGGFLPTGETLAFLLANTTLAPRTDVVQLLSHDHPLIHHRIVELGGVDAGEPRLSGPLTISHAYLVHLTTGQQIAPEDDALFPAVRITTELEWADLVLEDFVREEIDHLHLWLQKGNYLLHDLGLKKHLKPGYRSLFYGPPGTGKTLTACLLGKSTGREVYRIDLSMVVSKYIGETEKNLKRVFDYAEQREWILFFDEADALFGKRTQTKSSNDRYANQEVAYLLQRIEDFPGVVTLASNLRSNMDEAFTRRFQSMVYFPMPGAENRYKIWQGIFSGVMQPAEGLDLHQLARQHELAGGAAINVFRYGALRAAARNETVITHDDLLTGIAREFQKDGKTINTR